MHKVKMFFYNQLSIGVNMPKIYSSTFSPSSFVQDEILAKGNITMKDETPAQMVERVVAALYHEELRFSQGESARIFAESLGMLMDAGDIVFSTPIMTNAGRGDVNYPLSACTVPPINLHADLNSVRMQVDTYHQEAMGTGFNFYDTKDPVATLIFLNQIALEGSRSGKEARPVGNMGICGIDHPRIVEFITAKMLRHDMPWKFNISINTPESFWLAVTENKLWTLRNGSTLYARELFQLITQAAHSCACPGIVFMDRFNRDNPVPGMGSYTSVAPCAEVGLLPGETCQFGYINIGAFVKNGNIDLDRLADTTSLLVRALDNCIGKPVCNGIQAENRDRYMWSCRHVDKPRNSLRI
jgi:ribonucleoside-diphosphate reductase alpha chain